MGISTLKINVSLQRVLVNLLSFYWTLNSFVSTKSMHRHLQLTWALFLPLVLQFCLEQALLGEEEVGGSVYSASLPR